MAGTEFFDVVLLGALPAWLPYLCSVWSANLLDLRPLVCHTSKLESPCAAQPLRAVYSVKATFLPITSPARLAGFIYLFLIFYSFNFLVGGWGAYTVTAC